MPVKTLDQTGFFPAAVLESPPCRCCLECGCFCSYAGKTVHVTLGGFNRYDDSTYLDNPGFGNWYDQPGYAVETQNGRTATLVESATLGPCVSQLNGIDPPYGIPGSFGVGWTVVDVAVFCGVLPWGAFPAAPDGFVKVGTHMYMWNNLSPYYQDEIFTASDPIPVGSCEPVDLSVMGFDCYWFNGIGGGRRWRAPGGTASVTE